MSPTLDPAQQRRYLRLLGVAPAPPTPALLGRLVRAHLERVPFENLSKLYYLAARGLRGVPDLDLFLDGIERHRLGGTCYSSNPYLAGLLRALGFEVDLLGADMADPDVHAALLVRVAGEAYHVDVGYGAPLFAPAPRSARDDHEAPLGRERWVVKPRDAAGCSRVEHYRDGALVHGYLAKPTPREPDFFQPAITASFAPGAHFMTHLRVVRFTDGASVALEDRTLVAATATTWTLTRLAGDDEVVAAVAAHFGIAAEVTRTALAVVAAHPGPAA